MEGAAAEDDDGPAAPREREVAAAAEAERVEACSACLSSFLKTGRTGERVRISGKRCGVGEGEKGRTLLLDVLGRGTSDQGNHAVQVLSRHVESKLRERRRGVGGGGQGTDLELDLLSFLASEPRALPHSCTRA